MFQVVLPVQTLFINSVMLLQQCPSVFPLSPAWSFRQTLLPSCSLSQSTGTRSGTLLWIRCTGYPQNFAADLQIGARNGITKNNNEGVRGFSVNRTPHTKLSYNIVLPTSLNHELLLLSSRVWNALTDNYGNVMPVDWKTSHTRSLHLPTLNLIEHEVTQTDSHRKSCLV